MQTIVRKYQAKPFGFFHRAGFLLTQSGIDFWAPRPLRVYTRLPLVAASFSFADELERGNPVRKGSAKPPEDGGWSIDHRLAGEKATRAGTGNGIRETGLGTRCFGRSRQDRAGRRFRILWSDATTKQPAHDATSSLSKIMRTRSSRARREGTTLRRPPIGLGPASSCRGIRAFR